MPTPFLRYNHINLIWHDLKYKYVLFFTYKTRAYIWVWMDLYVDITFE